MQILQHCSFFLEERVVWLFAGKVYDYVRFIRNADDKITTGCMHTKLLRLEKRL